MALAELMAHRYEDAPDLQVERKRTVSYRIHKADLGARGVVYLANSGAFHRKKGLEMKRLELQLRRPITEARPLVSNRPSIANWIMLVINGAGLFSFALVVAALVTFLSELSAGRPALLIPSFSAFFVFSVVGLAALRLRQSVKFMQSNSLPQ